MFCPGGAGLKEGAIMSSGWHRLGVALAVLAMLPFLFLSFTGADRVIWEIDLIGLGVAASLYVLTRSTGWIIAVLKSRS